MKTHRRSTVRTLLAAAVLAAVLAAAPGLAGTAPAEGESQNSAASSAATAEEGALPEQQIHKILADYTAQMEAFSNAYRAAQSEQDRQKLVDEKYPRPDAYASKLMDLARQNPKTPAARDALVWIVEHQGGQGDLPNQALKQLARDHADDPQVANQVVPRLSWSGSPAAADLLQAVIDKAPNHDAKGKATLVLGVFHKNQAAMRGENTAGTNEERKQAEDLLQQVVRDFADVKSYRGTLADAANAELYELHNLQIGQPAPEIVGQTVTGQPLRLSDYKGKVVVLDFFGDW